MFPRRRAAWESRPWSGATEAIEAQQCPRRHRGRHLLRQAGYGLARCTWRGLGHFRACVWSAVVAYEPRLPRATCGRGPALSRPPTRRRSTLACTWRPLRRARGARPLRPFRVCSRCRPNRRREPAPARRPRRPIRALTAWVGRAMVSPAWRPSAARSTCESVAPASLAAPGRYSTQARAVARCSWERPSGSRASARRLRGTDWA